MTLTSLLVAILVTCCSLPCCAGIIKVPNEADGKDDVLFDSAEVLAINKLPMLLQKLQEGSYGNIDKVEVWLEAYNRQLENLTYEQELARWNYITNLTDENAWKSEEVEKGLIEWAEEQQPEALRYSYHFKRCDSGLAPCKPASINYELQVIVNTQSSAAPKNQTLRDEMLRSSTQLQSIYSKAKLHKDGKTYNLEPEITELMATSKDYDELLWAWVGWRNATGREMRTFYDRFVHLENMGAHDIGLQDAGTHWRVANYDMDGELETMVDCLFSQVMPLYRQLHAYVRRKLMARYPNRGIRPTGAIPAHLLGNMWAQEWNNIYDLLVPFPEVSLIDVTSTMRAQNYTPARMFRTAEEFYTSIGLDPMTDTFWEKSMLTRPTDREVVCHASAEDFFLDDDYRIKMCTTVSQEDLTTIHHEMGHIEYFMQYRHQKPIFRNGANAAFHEAIGDTIALSVNTPGHLQKIKLMNRTGNSSGPQQAEDDHKREINFLMKMALEKVAFLPFGYLIDKYRWEVFRGNINIENYNSKWWEYRLKYQGIEPPVPRSEQDFDPGAKYHVAADVPYMRYFLSFIGQFQFHKSLCELAGDFKKLHDCDIYNSKRAGERLKSALSLGSSRPWPDVMQVLTGQRKFSASAIKEYFEPLITWLKEQNADEEEVGWEGEFNPGNGDPEVREWLSARSEDYHEVKELIRTLLEEEESKPDL